MKYRLIAAEKTKTGHTLLLEHNPVWWEIFLGQKVRRVEYLELEGIWHELPAMRLCSKSMVKVLSHFQHRV